MSDGMGTSMTAAKLTDIRRNKFMMTPLQKVGKDFYAEVRNLLSSMMDTLPKVSGEDMRDGYADKIRKTMLTANEVVMMRTRKVMEMATEESFHRHPADLTQATPEERKLFAGFIQTIAHFKAKGGLR